MIAKHQMNNKRPLGKCEQVSHEQKMKILVI